ncbi:MAG TPA: hypothetical protein VFO51_02465 [Sphingomicrobium sp.]|nr:hypothetical protein [Sphingomicrobium sp.]
MRCLACLSLLSVAGCAAPATAPSLAPRAAEAIDPRVPVPEKAVPTDVSAALAGRLEVLVAQAVTGHEAFWPVAERAEQLARSAGPVQSESWIVAQQALSAAVAAREPLTRALGDIDSLGAESVQQHGGIGAADLEAIKAAAARVGEIDRSEAAVIDRIQGLLAR